VLLALVAVFGPALQRIPIDTLRFVVGALLLAFGLQWLRKAILRSSGFKPLHDEDEAYREERVRRGRRAGREGPAGLVLVHHRLQGRAARGPRDRVHRDRVRHGAEQRRSRNRARRCSGPIMTRAATRASPMFRPAVVTFEPSPNPTPAPAV
jgi:hypothetical protein